MLLTRTSRRMARTRIKTFSCAVIGEAEQVVIRNAARGGWIQPEEGGSG
jgi:hypothetical protein